MVRVRFAPSPTGYLHIGNTRTALINYLFAGHEKGKLILRIEDTDIERSDAIYETAILEDLAWLGIEWDEGPIRQSDRIGIHRDCAQTLLEKGHAYKCFCSKEELEQMRSESLRKGEPPRYNGKCRGLPEAAVRTLEEEGRPYVVRFKSLEKAVAFTDAIHGNIEFPPDHVDDFILLKQGLTPSYNFAAAIDDMLMNITHVIRGADHISNTPKQIMLFEVFGYRQPEYAHHSLLIGNDRKPLSKRHGVTGLREFRSLGILPQALMNYVGIIGRNIGKEYMEREELVETFSLPSLSSSDSVFDMEKLLWLNKEHMRGAPVELLLKEAGLSSDQREKVFLLKENAKTLNDIKEMMNIFDGVDISDEAAVHLKGLKGAPGIMQELKAILQENHDISFDELLRKLQGITDTKKRDLLMTLRIISTGRKNGPPLGEMFHLVPKKSILERLQCLEETFSHP